MKSKLLYLGLLASASIARADFDPIPLLQSSYNADVIVERTTATLPLGRSTRATMDAGTNNTGNTWYEVGFNAAAPTTGIPAAGSTFIHQTFPDHSYTMAPSFSAPNALAIVPNQVLNGTLTLTTPATYSSLSVLAAGGGGGCVISYTIHFADSSIQTGTLTVVDWFNGANPAWVANGRASTTAHTVNTVNGGNPRIYNYDIALNSSAVAVTSIDFSYVSGSGGDGIFAVSGAPPEGGNWAPITVTGYNYDIVIEASAPQPGTITGVTTASMDGGTANTGNTWFERGYDPFNPNAGLPHPGETITSSSLPDHHYLMPSSYANNNAIYVDSAHPIANLTLEEPRSYSALSFLNATANNNVTNQCIMQYEDGTSETNLFVARDWFNNTPIAFTANGRVSLNNKQFNNINAGNPRLYEAQFVLGNTVSRITNVVLKFIGAINPTTGRAVIFAVSATAGSLPPIINTQPQPVNIYDGGNASFFVTLSGGTPPITYKWQKGTNGVWVDVVNGGTVTGSTTSNLVINPASVGDQADYRVVLANVAGTVTSVTAPLTVISTLADVTAPGDPITAFGGTSPAAETVDHATDNLTSKYLNFGSGPNASAAPFVGPIGFVVSPSMGMTVVKGVRIYTANDGEERDPADFVLEGSTDGGSSWSLITSNALALPAGRNAPTTPAAINPLAQFLQQVLFENPLPYTTYRFSVTRVKNATAANSCQFGEVELLGTTFDSAPVLLQQPASVRLFAGGTARFSVKAIGTQPLTYKWFKGADEIPDATSATLTLPNADIDVSGDFHCVASNTLGDTPSSTATLTVEPQPLDNYPSLAVLSDNPIGYWRLNEASGSVAYDQWGSHNGAYSNATLGAYGYNAGDADPAATFGSVVPNSYVGEISGIDFAPAGVSAAFTVEAWVKGPPQTNDAGIVTKGTGGGGEQFNIDCGGPSHAFRFFVRDSTNGVHLCASTVTPNNEWHHVVGVCDIPGGSVYLYVDGVLASSAPMTNPLLTTPRPVSIGGRQSGSGAFDLGFIGTVDEVAIYDRALTVDLIQTHYAIGSDVPVLTVTAGDASRTYGAANPAFSVSYSGFVYSDNESLLSGSPAVSTAAVATSPVGPYSIDVARGTLAYAKSYKFAFQPGTLSVTRAPLTVTADNKSKFAGEANPALTASYSGFVNLEDASVLTGSPALSTLADQNSAPGDYAITAAAGDLSSPNYSFSFENGTLTVLARPLLTSVSQNGTQFTFSYPTVSGRNYQVLYKDDLGAADWSPLGGPVAGTGSPITVSYDLSESPQRFFQISILP